MYFILPSSTSFFSSPIFEMTGHNNQLRDSRKKKDWPEEAYSDFNGDSGIDPMLVIEIDAANS